MELIGLEKKEQGGVRIARPEDALQIARINRVARMDNHRLYKPYGLESELEKEYVTAESAAPAYAR